jgi:hypothetical protein
LSTRSLRGCLLAGALLLSAGLADAGESPQLVIRDVTLLDGTGSAPRPGVSVWISGERVVAVQPGGAATATIPIDPRLLADSRNGRWTMPAGAYGFALGRSATDLGPVVTVTLPARQWR